MDRKTALNINGYRSSETTRMADKMSHSPGNMPPGGGLARDLLELGELQFKLLRTDLTEAMQATKWGSIMLVLSAAFLIAVVPILLLALTLGIEELFDLSRGISLLITGGVATLVGILLLWLGWTIVQRGAGKMSRSAHEFKNNMRWIKRLVTSPTHHEHNAERQ